MTPTATICSPEFDLALRLDLPMNEHDFHPSPLQPAELPGVASRARFQSLPRRIQDPRRRGSRGNFEDPYVLPRPAIDAPATDDLD